MSISKLSQFRNAYISHNRYKKMKLCENKLYFHLMILTLCTNTYTETHITYKFNCKCKNHYLFKGLKYHSKTFVRNLAFHLTHSFQHLEIQQTFLPEKLHFANLV